jgi:arginase family enzyme
MERDECRGYSVLGLQGFSNASAHIDYLRGKGGDFFWAESVTPSLMQSTLADAGEPIMVSFDMDAVDQSAAPGVSAPCPSGLSPALWLDLAFRAGASSHVTSFELVEVNPRFDVDGATVRLAAATVWNFLRGVAAR